MSYQALVGTIVSPRSSGSRHPCARTECVLSLLKCQASFKEVLLYCYFLSQKTLRCELKGVIPPPEFDCWVTQSAGAQE